MLVACELTAPFAMKAVCVSSVQPPVGKPNNSGAAQQDRGTANASGSHRIIRRDIQALRAVAVSLVLVYHLWPGSLSGGFVGVDVFFVISGFLITRILIGHADINGRTMAHFWERRIRRLLPAGLLVVGLTLAGSRLVAPETDWARTAKEAVASAFYVQNWVLAHDSVDYLRAEDPPSPLQHYWTLSVEEQFYILWPLLIWALLWWTRRRRLSSQGPLLLAVGVVCLVSFAYSLHFSRAQPAAAYFATPTRMWELAIGALVAVWALNHVQKPESAPRLLIRSLLAWTGLAAIVYSALTISPDEPFTGSSAAFPVVGAALFVAAASNSGFASPVRLGGNRGVQWLGDISYSLYLWHWPLITLAPHVLGPLDGRHRIGLLIVALVGAGLSKRFVEDRWRRPRPATPIHRVYVLGLSAMLVVAVAAYAQIREVDHRLEVARTALKTNETTGDPCFGSGALVEGPRACPRDAQAKVVPSPALAVADRSEIYEERCMLSPPYGDVRTCVFGNPDGKFSIALAGNSHSSQWLDPLQALAEKYDLKITTFIGSQCITVEGLVAFKTRKDALGCRKWAQDVRTMTTGGRFDLVITSQRNVFPMAGYQLANSQAAWEKGYSKFLAAWAGDGTDILVIKDTPFPKSTGIVVPQCVGDRPNNQNACSGSRAEWLPDDPLYRAAVKLGRSNVTTADFSDALCEPERCYGVNGGVISYFDGSHMTSTFARTLAAPLDKVLSPLVH